MLLSIVIPALDAAETLGAVIGAIEEGSDGAFALEIIVVDGGSGDETAAIGQDLGARVIEAPRGRGSQLIAGADAASGEWMMFLHADTRLGLGWMSAAARFAGDPEKYAPRFGGYCAWAVSQGYTASIDPEAWTVHKGKLYLNYSIGVRDEWAQDIPGNIAKGENNWPKVLDN